MCLVGGICRGGMGWTWDLGCLDGSRPRDRDIPPSIFPSDSLTPRPTFLRGRRRSLLSSHHSQRLRFFSRKKGSSGRQLGDDASITGPGRGASALGGGAAPGGASAARHGPPRRRRGTGPRGGGVGCGRQRRRGLWSAAAVRHTSGSSILLLH